MRTENRNCKKGTYFSNALTETALIIQQPWLRAAGSRSVLFRPGNLDPARYWPGQRFAPKVDKLSG